MPVILLTGSGDIMDPVGDRPVGVDLILGKPVGLQALREAIRTASTPQAE